MINEVRERGERDRELITKIMSDNYEQKLSAEIISRNYYRKLSSSIYHYAKNVGIIGILAYPKKSKTNIFLFQRGSFYFSIYMDLFLTANDNSGIKVICISLDVNT